MKRKFVVCVDDSTKEQQNKLTQFFKNEANMGYWHWLSDLWLVTDPNNYWSAGSLRDKVGELLPGSHNVVIQIDGPIPGVDSVTLKCLSGFVIHGINSLKPSIWVKLTLNKRRNLPKAL